jgi:cell division protein FtsB
MRKVLADMHVPPKAKRWASRLGLALLVVVVIGYIPSKILSRDPKAAMLAAQLATLQQEADRLATDNASKRNAVEGLQNRVDAIEDRARHDLGMVYPNEIIIRIDRASSSVNP